MGGVAGVRPRPLVQRLPRWTDPEGRRGRQSAAKRILPEFQQVAVDEVLLDGPGCSPVRGAWWVRAAVPVSHLVLYSFRTVGGREMAALRRLPRTYFDCSWAFVLRSAWDGSTRLLVTSPDRADRRSLYAPLTGRAARRTKIDGPSTTSPPPCAGAARGTHAGCGYVLWADSLVDGEGRSG